MADRPGHTELVLNKKKEGVKMTLNLAKVNQIRKNSTGNFQIVYHSKDAAGEDSDQTASNVLKDQRNILAAAETANISV